MMAGPIDIALVGYGKIARDQHRAAIAGSAAFGLVATVDPRAPEPSLPGFAAIEELIDANIAQAVAICTPPAARFDATRAAIAAGLHVLLEKPPGLTPGEVAALEAAAKAAGVTLFAAWHSRAAAGVEPARAWLAGRTITAVRIAWREDIRVWHPGQEWILDTGGFGVFDPGINALSILTRLLPEPPIVRSAEFSVPANRAMPIAATLALTAGAAPVTVALDFLYEGEQRWDMEVETTTGRLALARGGAALFIDGEDAAVAGDGEYPRLYARFGELVASGDSDVDALPLAIVADAFLLASRTGAAPFSF